MASATYASVKTALSTQSSKVRLRTTDIYLQGSYRNTTNIRGDSDVDVVVELEDCFGYDISRLTDVQKGEFGRRYPNATYTFNQFRDDVEQSLVSYYGRQLIIPRNKCIEVVKSSGRLNADVVPCQTFRVYPNQPNVVLPSPVEGIQFFRRDNSARIINYPKVHYQNGVEKHRATNDWYKPTVRIYKNLAVYMVDRHELADGIAPSYFIECLIFNVPNAKFGRSYQLSFLNSMLWLYETSKKPEFGNLMCGNGVLPLFGNEPTQWNQASARTFILACLTVSSKWQ